MKREAAKEHQPGPIARPRHFAATPALAPTAPDRPWPGQMTAAEMLECWPDVPASDGEDYLRATMGDAVADDFAQDLLFNAGVTWTQVGVAADRALRQCGGMHQPHSDDGTV